MTKKTHYLPLLCLSFSILFSDQSFADARRSKFRSKNKPSEYLTLGGNYSADHNSKEYKISGSYQYVGSRFINEIDFLQQTRYSSTSTKPLEKNRDLYDVEISSKILISNSSNYFNYFNRTRYDSFSDYYYDVTNAIGWGRSFFDGLLEADMNVGYNNIKNFDSQIVFNPSLKANFWLTDRLKFTTKGSIFQVKDSYSEELRSRLSYRMTRSLWLELYHNYDKKRFVNTTSKGVDKKTEVSRNLIFRIRYNF